METFSLLKYWRGGGTATGEGGGNICVNPRSATTAGGTTTIVTAVHQAVDTDDDDGDDDGPFFDLEFAVPDEDEIEETEENEGIDEDEESEDQNDDGDAKSDDDRSDDEREFNFTLSSGSSDGRSDPNLTQSPSDDLFFKGRLVPIEANPSLDSKPSQFPVSLLKSATKFRVFLLKLKKSKLNNSTEKTESASANGSVSVPAATPKKPETTQEENSNNNNNNKNKFFTVKFKVEEAPIISLFSRDNSKSQKQQSSEDSVSDEKKFSKEVMQKYLRKVKPLYVRVSRRYVGKLRLSGQLNSGSLKPATPPSTAAQKPVPGKATTGEKGQVEAGVGENQVNGKNIKQANIPARLRVVCKHLGKSRSASSAVAAVPPAPTSSNRRDDSLLQQQDGIQSAILHCKRSFNGSRDASESSILPRSVSDPSHEKSMNLSRISAPDETKA